MSLQMLVTPANETVKRMKGSSCHLALGRLGHGHIVPNKGLASSKLRVQTSLFDFRVPIMLDIFIVINVINNIKLVICTDSITMQWTQEFRLSQRGRATLHII